MREHLRRGASLEPFEQSAAALSTNVSSYLGPLQFSAEKDSVQCIGSPDSTRFAASALWCTPGSFAGADLVERAGATPKMVSVPKTGKLLTDCRKSTVVKWAMAETKQVI
jgi:hypothetical protein